jgi:hypothetical protein
VATRRGLQARPPAPVDPDPWATEIARAERQRDAIAECVAPSPRQAAWLFRTEAAVFLMRLHYRRLKAHGPLRWGDRGGRHGGTAGG